MNIVKGVSEKYSNYEKKFSGIYTAIAYMIICQLAITATGVFIQICQEDGVSNIQIFFIRQMLVALFSFVIGYIKNEPLYFKDKSLMNFGNIRGMLSMLTTIFFVLSLNNIEISIFSLVNNTLPLINLILSRILLSEPLEAINIICALGTFGGATFPIYEKVETKNIKIIGIILTLIYVFSGSLSVCFFRYSNTKLTWNQNMFYFSFPGVVLLSPLYIMNEFTWISFKNFALIFWAAFFSAIVIFLTVKAFSMGNSAVLGIFTNFLMIFSFLSDYFVFQVSITKKMYEGALIIIIFSVILGIVQSKKTSGHK